MDILRHVGLFQKHISLVLVREIMFLILLICVDLNLKRFYILSDGGMLTTRFFCNNKNIYYSTVGI